MLSFHVPKNPCESCPYRRDVPSAVWDADEYEKLRGYDDPQTAFAPFLCHHSLHEERVCRGWLAVQCDSAAVRILVIEGVIQPEVPFEPVDVPLFASGNEAADAGLVDIENPGFEACRLMRRIERAR